MAMNCDRGTNPVAAARGGPLRGDFAPAEWVVSHQLHDTAKGLLSRALRAVRNSDEKSARTSVTQAIRLPFDQHEREHPTWAEASLLVYSTIADSLGADPPEDVGWLDGALTVLPVSGPHARREFLRALVDIDRDWRLQGPPSWRIREVSRELLGGPGPPTNPVGAEIDHVDAILEVLRAVCAYQDARATRTSEPPGHPSHPDTRDGAGLDQVRRPLPRSSGGGCDDPTPP
jgi:hypothetical protein